MKADKDYKLKYKTEIKKSCDEHQFKYTVSNKDYTGEWEYKPADLNKDGIETTLEVEHKCVPDKKEWEAEAELKVGGYSSGVVSGWSELQFNTNSKQQHELTFSQNILCEKKYHSAFKVVQQLGEKKGL